MVDWTPELKQRVLALIDAGKNSAEIAAEIGASKQSIQTAKKRHNLPAMTPIDRRKPRPDNLAELWPTMSQRDLARHFHVTQTTVGRWRDELGLERKLRNTDKARLTNNLVPRRIKHGITARIGPKPAPEQPYRHGGLAGEAQRVLQRYAACFRCTERGAADPKGNRWRYGNAILTDAELISRAQAKQGRAA